MMRDRPEPTTRSRRLILLALLVAGGLLPSMAEAGRIDRLLWNALRFSRQAEFFQQAADRTGLPLTSFDLRYDNVDFVKGNTTTISPGFQFALSENGFFYTEIPYGFLDWEGAGPRAGFGDLLLEYQHVLYVNETGRVDALAFAIDLVAPTGDTTRGIGEGAWVGFPSLTGIVELRDDLFLAPSVVYVHSFQPLLDRPSSVFLPGRRSLEANVRQGLLSLNLIHFLNEKTWVLVSPDAAHDLESGDTSLDLRVGFGIMASKDFNMSLQFTEHLDGPTVVDRSISLTFGHLF